MKKHLLILILALPMFFWQGVKGQGYEDILIPNSSTWQIAHKQLAGKFIDTIYLKDIINGYKEVWYKGNYFYFEEVNIGKVRSNNDNSRLYFKTSPYINTHDTTEKLIFNLNLSIGDTFSFGYYVDTVANVFYLNGLKHIEFKNISTNWGEKVRFIEGIGPNTGIFVNYLGILDPYVICKYEKDSLIYVTQNTNFIGCALNTQIVNDHLSLYNIKISPNPAKEFFIISVENFSAHKNAFLYIYNINGISILQEIIDKNKYIVDISHLKSGIYIVRIIIDDTVTHIKLIKQ